MFTVSGLFQDVSKFVSVLQPSRGILYCLSSYNIDIFLYIDIKYSQIHTCMYIQISAKKICAAFIEMFILFPKKFNVSGSARERG